MAIDIYSYFASGQGFCSRSEPMGVWPLMLHPRHLQSEFRTKCSPRRESTNISSPIGNKLQSNGLGGFQLRTAVFASGMLFKPDHVKIIYPLVI